MLTTTIRSKTDYDYRNERFRKAFEFLRTEDFQKYTSPCEIEIDGRNVYAQVQIYETKPADECRFEAHRDYFDIQYMAEGEEYMGFAPLSHLEEDLAYDPSLDLAFYKMPTSYGRIWLQEGDYAAVSPEDGHMPRCIGAEKKTVKKIVVKVKVGD